MDEIRWIGRGAVLAHWLRPVYRWTRKFLFVVFSAALEKNPVKLIAMEAPIVFSMSRLVVLAFTVAMVRRLWLPGGMGWPDVTLAAILAIALPLVGALSRQAPAEVVQFANKIVDKFGVGDVGQGSGGGPAR